MLVVADVYHLPDRTMVVLDAVVDALPPPGSALTVAGSLRAGAQAGPRRVRTGLTEIGITELRWTTTQTLGLAREWRVEITPAEVADLVERTEGWPAAVARTLAERAGGGGAVGRPEQPGRSGTRPPGARPPPGWLEDLGAAGDVEPADGLAPGDVDFLRRAAPLVGSVRPAVRRRRLVRVRPSGSTDSPATRRSSSRSTGGVSGSGSTACWPPP